MAKKNKNAEVVVSIVESSEFTEDFGCYYSTVNYLNEKWDGIFSNEKAKRKPYVAGLLKKGKSKPEIHYFGRRSAVIKFINQNPTAVARYRYCEEMVFLM